MKDFLLVLFYQAIVAVNTAVILNAIIWLAKRKEKREKNPNQDFTHSPAKKPPKPPTTGTNLITPEEDKSDYFSCLRSVFPGNLTREQVLDGLERYIKGYNPDRIFDQFENEMRERAKRETQCVKTEPIKGEYFTKEIRGGLGNQLLATVTANSEEELEEKLKTLADAFDRTDKKPVTPEMLKEAGFETEYLNAKCEECENWKRDSQIFGHCTLRRCPVKAYERRQCQFFKKWEPKPKTALEAMCRNCKHFQVMDTRTGLCGEMDEIVFANSYRACFEPRKTNTERKCGNCVHGIAPVDGSVFCVAVQRGVEADGEKAENCPVWAKRPAPLGTVATH